MITVCSNTISQYSKCEQSKRPEVAVQRFPENQHNFHKKCTVLSEKNI